MPLTPSKFIPRPSALIACLAGLGVALGTAVAADPYLRAAESAENGTTTLEVAVREFTPADHARGPKILLVGVTHIGDKAYYDKLQELLDAQDLVLFEGVKPGDEDAALAQLDPADRARVRLSTQRVRTLAALMERTRENEKYADSVGSLLTKLPEKTVARAKPGLKDAWGNPLVLVVKNQGGAFDVTSLGSDGEPGGEGAASDLAFSAQPPLSPQELGRSEDGIQSQLASALGLKFQLDAIDYNRPDWRNSDMSVTELQRAFGNDNESSEQLFGMLGGQGVGASLAKFVLGMIGSNPQMGAMAKLLMIEMVANADQLMEQAQDSAPGIGGMMKVLVHDRNDVVFRDLTETLEVEKNVKSIALFYGAGHMGDMQSRLEEMGYVAGEENWLTAITVRAKDTGLPPEGVAKTREMLRKVMKMQLDQQAK
jgi:hypothetical protein